MNQGFPLITVKRKGKAIEEVDFPDWKADTIPKPVLVEYEEALSVLQDKALVIARAGGIVLWVENTVGEAQEAYRFFAGRNFLAGLLHSRYISQHRADNEQEWITKLGKGGDRSMGAILVSTQVCEQSLDIDADALFTNLCPTDMLLQRIGRMWRHRQNDQQRTVSDPVVYIRAAPDPLVKSADSLAGTVKEIKALRTAWGNSSFVYDLYTLCRAAMVWAHMGGGSIKVPDDVRSLLDLTYGNNPTSLPFQALKDLMDKECQRLTMLAAVNLNRHSLFQDTPGSTPQDDTAGMQDEPSTAGTRDINDGSVKACLLVDTGVTLLGEEVRYPSHDRAETKRRVLMSSLTLPAGTVKKLGKHLLEGGDPRGIPGDKYTRTVRMAKTGDFWEPVDSETGRMLREADPQICLRYNHIQGWVQ